MTTILLRRSHTAGAIPTASQLEPGEPAVNTADGYIYMEHTDFSVKRIGTTADRVSVAATASTPASDLQSIIGQVAGQSSATQLSVAPLTGLISVNNGKLGVGTSNPTDTVHVSSAGAASLKVSNSTESISTVLQAGVLGGSVGSLGSYKFSIRVNGQDAALFDSSRRMTLPAQPRFHAYISSDAATTGVTTQPILPESTSLNVGTCYSPITGRFTAPIAGTYYIYAQVMFQGTADGGDWVKWGVRKNDTTAILMSADAKAASSQYVSPSSGRLIQLAANDFLALTLDSATSGVAIQGGEGNTFFGAYLVG